MVSNQPEHLTFAAADGYSMHCYAWKPASARARVVYLHGIQSHGGWYAGSSRKLFEAGYEVYQLDRRGSGRNQTERGHAQSFEQLIDDVAGVLEQLGPEHRRVLLGVSWGGKLALAVAAARPDLIDVLGLIAPGLTPRVRPPLTVRLLIALTCFTWRRLHVPIPLNDPALFTDEPQWQQFIREDADSLRKATAWFMYQSYRLDRFLLAQRNTLQCSTVVWSAGKDRIIDNEALDRYLEALPAPVTRRRFQDAAHTLEFDPVRDTFFADLVDQLDRLTS